MDISCFNKFKSKENITPADFLSAVINFYDENEDSIVGNNLDDVGLFYTQLSEVSDLFSDLLLSYPSSTGEQIDALKTETTSEIKENEQQINSLRDKIQTLDLEEKKLRKERESLKIKEAEYQKQLDLLEQLNSEISAAKLRLREFSPDIIAQKNAELEQITSETQSNKELCDSLDNEILKLISENDSHVREYKRLTDEKERYLKIISTDLSEDKKAVAELQLRAAETDEEIKRMKNTYIQWIEKLSCIREYEEELIISDDNFSDKLIKVNNLLNGEIDVAKESLEKIKLGFREILLQQDDVTKE